MKKAISIIIITLTASITYAQKLRPNALIKAHAISLITESVGNDKMSVHNSNSLYHNKKPRNRNPDITIKRGDNGGMLKAFLSVFSDDRIKQLLPENVLPMTFYIDTNGHILEVDFIVNNNTSITAPELENLAKAIKANVWFTIPQNEIKGQDFIDIAQGVRFSRILDRTVK